MFFSQQPDPRDTRMNRRKLSIVIMLTGVIRVRSSIQLPYVLTDGTDVRPI